MNWTELLNTRLAEVERATLGLLDLVEDDRLDWRPECEGNWMTMGQLLRHLAEASGVVARGFVTEDWSFMTAGTPGETMPSAESVAEAREGVRADCRLTAEMIAQAGEEALSTRKMAAPWFPPERLLGVQIMECIDHLASHKAQLFYYLKMQGKPVNTGHLWGIEMPE